MISENKNFPITYSVGGGGGGGGENIIERVKISCGGENIVSHRFHHSLPNEPLWAAFIHFPIGQYGCHFADYIYNCIIINEKFCILINILLKFVLNGPFDNNPAFEVMA